MPVFIAIGRTRWPAATGVRAQKERDPAGGGVAVVLGHRRSVWDGDRPARSCRWSWGSGGPGWPQPTPTSATSPPSSSPGGLRPPPPPTAKAEPPGPTTAPLPSNEGRRDPRGNALRRWPSCGLSDVLCMCVVCVVWWSQPIIHRHFASREASVGPGVAGGVGGLNAFELCRAAGPSRPHPTPQVPAPGPSLGLGATDPSLRHMADTEPSPDHR